MVPAGRDLTPDRNLSAVRATMVPMNADSTGEQEVRPAIDVDLVVLDTDDPKRLADFYCALLGWSVESAEEDWVTIGGGSGVRLAFQFSLHYRPPTWPDNAIPQQFHLDLRVERRDVAGAYAESIGARRSVGGGGRSFDVFTDPSGHPFCLTTGRRMGSCRRGSRRDARGRRKRGSRREAEGRKNGEIQ